MFVFVSCYPLRHLSAQKDIIIIRQHQTSGCPDTFTFAAQRRILLAAVHRTRGTLPASGANSLLRQNHQLLQFIDCSGRPACPLVHRASSLLQPLRPTLNFLRAEPSRERGPPTYQVVTFNMCYNIDVISRFYSYDPACPFISRLRRNALTDRHDIS